MVNFSLLVKKIFIPTKLIPARKEFGGRPISVLDVGCGNNSYEITHAWLNVREYHGVDKEYWLGNDADYKKMDKVYFVDLDVPGGLHEVENESYDLIILHHVIEHLTRGYALIGDLYGKLAPGGMLYIETPSIRTINFPSGTGFLNFYDDATHKLVYPVARIVEACMGAGLRVSAYGVRRDWKRLLIFSLPAILWNVFYALPIRRKADARGLWDLLGVASYVVARKPGKPQSSETPKG